MNWNSCTNHAKFILFWTLALIATILWIALDVAVKAADYLCMRVGRWLVKLCKWVEK
jgi:hypothetical protein